MHRWQVAILIVALVLLSPFLFGADAFAHKQRLGPIKPVELPEAKVKKIIDAMSVEQKLGQMLMMGIPDSKLSRETADFLRRHYIGGALLLGQNVASRGQVKKLTRDLQRLAANSMVAPLFIAVDQEGGAISRFTFLREPTPQESISGYDQARRIALQRGKELKTLGVNVNFSPVLDVASTGDFMYERTFRGDEKRVAHLGSGMIHGYQEAGILAVAKHFPGHGGTDKDSHKELPVLNLDEGEWKRRLVPFHEAVIAGVPVVMVGHLKIPSVDSLYPASISNRIVAGVLREELQFRGVVITDDLGMKAITNSDTIPTAVLLAVAAGADILLISQNFQEYPEVIRELREAVGRGAISLKRLNDSVRRILLLKAKIKAKKK